MPQSLRLLRQRLTGLDLPAGAAAATVCCVQTAVCCHAPTSLRQVRPFARHVARGFAGSIRSALCSSCCLSSLVSASQGWIAADEQQGGKSESVSISKGTGRRETALTCMTCCSWPSCHQTCCHHPKMTSCAGSTCKCATARTGVGHHTAQMGCHFYMHDPGRLLCRVTRRLGVTAATVRLG